MGVRNCAELGENLQVIVKALCANQKLLKYLYYSDKDPLNHPDLEWNVIQEEIINKRKYWFTKWDDFKLKEELEAKRSMEVYS